MTTQQQPTSQQNLPATQKKQEKPRQIVTIGKYIQQRLPSLASMAEKSFDVERLYQAFLFQVSRSEKLLQCSEQSLFRAISQATLDSLSFTGGEAWLVPFKQTATYIPGWQGLAKKAVESGAVRFIESRVVYDGDFFDHDYGLHPKLVHRPCAEAERGEVKAAYAIARMTDQQGDLFEVMLHEDLEKIRVRSRAKDDGPWVTDTEEMYRKCPVRRLCKSVPRKSATLSRILEREDRRDAGLDDLEEEIADAPQLAEVSKTEELKERLKSETKTA